MAAGERPVIFADVDFCVVDTETTGGRAALHRVIEVAAFHVRDGIVLDRFSTLINPGRAIPPWISFFTGITDDMVKSAPSFPEVAQELRRFLDRGVFVAHNAPFDYNFIRAEFERVGETWMRPNLCTVRLARKLFPELPSRSLGPLCDHLMIDIYDRHRAAGDAEATIYVLKHMLKKVFHEHGVTSLGELESFLRPPRKSKPRRSSVKLSYNFVEPHHQDAHAKELLT
jgi:DNA polymerase-3 subunit epsilon